MSWWTLKDLRTLLIEETMNHNEDEIVYINTGSGFSPLCDGQLIFESDLEDQKEKR